MRSTWVVAVVEMLLPVGSASGKAHDEQMSFALPFQSDWHVRVGYKRSPSISHSVG